MKTNFKYICSVGAFALLLGAGIACTEEEPIYVPPTFKLSEVSDIMRTTARFSGSISGDVSKVREYGFEYSTTEEFTSSTTQKVIVGDSAVSSSYDAVVRNLEANERYYYRMFASTGASKVYSQAEYFQTAASSAPLLTSFVVDSIGENLARFKCTIEDVGDEYLIEYGVGYKTQTDKAYIPIPSDSIIPGTNNTYFVEINGLEPATRYSFRPYAKNSADAFGATGSREGYGEVLDSQTESLLSAEVLTTEIADGHIGVNSIDVSATLISATGSNGVINKCGFCWSQNNANPVITDDTLVLAPVKVGGIFSATIKNLSPKTRYYIRAYATNTVNGAERVGYGATYEVTTGGLKTPTIEFEYEENEWGGRDYQYTVDATSISIKAFIDAKDFDDNTMVEKGLIWSKTNGDIKLDEAKEFKTILSLDLKSGSSTTIEGTIKNLDMNTFYFVRAYVVAKADDIEVEGYSDYLHIHTNDFQSPSLVEAEIKDVTRTSATLIGGFYNHGNGNITEKGFCISKYADTYRPELTTEGVIVVKSDDDTFTEQVTGLKYGTNYAVRTYAIAELADRVDTVYAWYRDLYTNDVVRPAFKRQDVNISIDTVRIATGLDSKGDGEIVERGFHWQERTDNMPEFKLENSEHQKATGTDDSFSAVISGLKYATPYRISSYVKSLVDGDTIVHYGGVTHHFTTGGALRRIEHVSSGLTSLTVKCGIQGSGKGTIVEKGFIWLKDTDGSWKNPSFEDNPDDSNDGYTGYKTVTDGTDNEFSLEITGLLKNTRYYVRAYVKINCDGKESISYSGSDWWNTQDYNMPNFGSMNVPTDSIGFSTAVLQTSINDLGNLPIVKKGFVVHLASVTNEPALNNKLYQLDVESDEMLVKLAGLSHYTAYSVRAFATCKVEDKEETVYSSNRHFTTKRPEEPTFNSVRVDSIAYSSVKVTSGIASLNDGEGALLEKGFIWLHNEDHNYWDSPTFENYTKYMKVESDSINDYTLRIDSLLPGQRYTVRSYAKVTVDGKEVIGYSNGHSFQTNSLNIDVWVNPKANTCEVEAVFNEEADNVTSVYVNVAEQEGEENADKLTKFTLTKDEATGSYKCVVDGLSANTKHYIQFFYEYAGNHIHHTNYHFTTKGIPMINDNVSPGKKEDE